MSIAALITEGIGPGGSVLYIMTGGLDVGGITSQWTVNAATVTSWANNSGPTTLWTEISPTSTSWTQN